MESFENEIWKDCKGYEGKYMVSNLGRVKTIPHVRHNYCAEWVCEEKILGQILTQRGYLAVKLRRNNNTYTEQVHRLVALAFCDKPEGTTVVNHLNEIKTDNRAENLEWTTTADNNRYSNALHPERLVEIDVYKNGEYVGTYRGYKTISDLLKVPEYKINHSIHRKQTTRDGWAFRKAGEPLDDKPEEKPVCTEVLPDAV